MRHPDRNTVIKPEAEESMHEPVLREAIEKLAQAGEQAGISVEDMIRILNAGVTMDRLLRFIELRLSGARVCGDMNANTLLD